MGRSSDHRTDRDQHGLPYWLTRAGQFSYPAALSIFLIAFGLRLHANKPQLVLYLTGADCNRHLQACSSVNQLDPSIDLCIVLRSIDHPIRTRLVKTLGINTEHQISYLINDSLPRLDGISTSSVAFYDENKLITWVPIEDIATCVKVANLFQVGRRNRQSFPLNDSTPMSSDLLIETLNGIVFIVDRRLNLLKTASMRTTKATTLVELDTLLNSWYWQQEEKARPSNPAWGTPQRRAPLVTIASSGVSRDSVYILASYLLEPQVGDGAYGGVLVMFGKDGGSHIRRIQDLENPILQGHSVVARSGLLQVGQELIFNIATDSCSSRSAYFARCSNIGDHMTLKGFVPPDVPLMPLAPQASCYDFKEVLMKQGYAMMRHYPILLQIGDTTTHDLEALFKENDKPFLPIIERAIYYTSDFDLIDENTLAIIYRYDKSKWLAVIDLAQGKFVFDHRIPADPTGQHKFILHENGVLSVGGDGTLLIQN